MVKELLAPFAHRHNQDDTWDSICSKCFLVVATEENEEELREHEQNHDCAALRMARRTAGTLEPIRTRQL